MAMATSTAIALALAAASAGTQYYNTEKAADRADNQAATGIRAASEKQRTADAEVAAEVERMRKSSSEDERANALTSYMDTLRKGRQQSEAGLTPSIGSEAFKADSAAATTGVQDYGKQFASLMSRIEAPGTQRMNEGFQYGNLATNLGLIGREAAGDAYINNLRMNGIRRNAGLDFASSLMGAGAGAAAGSGDVTGYNDVGTVGSNTKTGTYTPKNYYKGP